jgi:hypothetical protein
MISIHRYIYKILRNPLKAIDNNIIKIMNPKPHKKSQYIQVQPLAKYKIPSMIKTQRNLALEGNFLILIIDTKNAPG